MNKNKNSKIMLILSILLLFIVIGAASAADDKLANETVSTTTNDDGVDTLNTEVDSVDEGVSTTDTNIGSNDAINQSSKNNNELLKSTGENNILKEEGNEGNFKELSTLISMSSSVVEITKDYKYNPDTDTIPTGSTTYGVDGMVISKTLIINGNNHIIDGNGLYTIFNIKADNVVINNLTFINTNASAIYWDGSNGVFNHSKIINITQNSNAYSFGSAIDWRGGNGRFINSTIQNAYTISYGAIISWGQDFRVIDSHFIGIKANRWCAVAYQSGSGFIDNCDFINCNATEGSAVGIVVGGAEADIKNSHFINCSKTASNNNVHSLLAGFLTVDNCDIINCTGPIITPANNGKIINTRIKNITATVGGTSYSVIGGANVDNVVMENCNITQVKTLTSIIDIKGNNYKFKNLQIHNNTAVSVLSYADKEYLTLDNIIVYNNTLTNAANFQGNYITITTANIYNNNISGNYGFIFVNNTKMNINISNIIYNNNADSKLYDTNYTIQPFPVYEFFYVSIDGNGTGNNQSSPTNLTFALNNVFYGGKIYLLPGNYSFPNIISSINITGLNKEKVIITGFSNFVNSLSLYNLTISMPTISGTLQTETKIDNCIFKDIQSLSITISDKSRFNNVLFQNITQFAVGLYSFITLSDLTFNNVNTTNRYFDSFNLQGKTNSFEHITILNSTLNRFFNHGSGDTYLSNLLTFKDFNIENSKFNDYVFNIGVNSYLFEDITIKNTTTKGIFKINPIKDRYGVSTFNGVSLDNVSCSEYVMNLPEGTTCTVNDLEIKNNSNINNIVSNGNVNLDTVTLSDSNFTYGIKLSEDCSLSNIDVNNCRFINYLAVLQDKSSLTGGSVKYSNGIIMLENDTLIKDVIFYKNGNSSNENGSCLYVNGEFAVVSNCEFYNNTAINGSSIYIVGDNCNILYSTFKNNTALNAGGAIYVKGAISYFADSNCVFSNNTAGAEGTHNIYDKDSYKTFNIVYVRVNGSTEALGNDSSIPVDFYTGLRRVSQGGTIVFLDTTVYQNPMTTDYKFNKPNVMINGSGSTINTTYAFIINVEGVVVNNLTFIGSSASSFIWNGKNGVINHCKFINNSLSENAGDSVIIVNGENLLVNNTQFKDNIVKKVDSQGGALFVNSTGLTVNYCIFDNNQAYFEGNHIYITNNANGALINNSEFKNSKSYTNTRGCAIYNSAYFVTVNNSTFENNNGSNGGAINHVSGTIKIDYSTFKNNTATSSGGALYLDSTVDSFKNNTLKFNKAQSNGGAVYSSVVLTMVDSDFINNSAVVNGGAVYSSNNIIIAGCDFINNSAVNGGALYLTGGINRLTGVVMENNKACDGSAIYLSENNLLSLDSVTLNSNVNASGVGTVYASGVNININNLTRGYDQSLYLGDYKSNVLYVNTSSSGWANGLTPNDASALTSNLLTHLNNGGKVIFINGVYDLSEVVEIYNKNIQFIGNASTITNKNDKSLFNNSLTHIKSCS